MVKSKANSNSNTPMSLEEGIEENRETPRLQKKKRSTVQINLVDLSNKPLSTAAIMRTQNSKI